MPTSRWPMSYLTREQPANAHRLHRVLRYRALSMWEHLDDAVREGTHRWRQTFDIEGPIFSHFFRTEEAMRTFMRGMHGFGLLSSPQVVEAFDLSGFRRMVDLGGGTGHLVIAACERYPELRGAVFDLPRVMPIAREDVELHRRQNAHRTAGRRFLRRRSARGRSVLPSAAFCTTGRKRRSMLLLRKVYAALPPGGALLIVERLLDDDKTRACPCDACSH